MCMDAVSHLVMQDEKIMELMSNPELDLIHKQVVMMLYALDAEGKLSEAEEMLQLYLSVDRDRCSGILAAIERAGLLGRVGDEIRLTHPIAVPDRPAACGCSMVSDNTSPR
ncbi:MAG: hypothetical protein LDL33_11440 [Desulfomonile sp.]|nr:hypothetical protein [Desulfomonile sp.]